MPDYRCSNCHRPTTPILCSVGVAADCCLESPVLVAFCPSHPDKCQGCETRPLTDEEERDLREDLFDGLPRASQKAIARGDAS